MLKYNSIDPKDFLEVLRREKGDYWRVQGERQALRLFREMARRVPAYKDFLKKNKIDTDKVKSARDFKNLPAIDKKNYLRAYPLNSLCWDGKLDEKRMVYSSTSGTTGEPFYFPRSSEQDWQYAFMAELYLRTNFQIEKKSTLYVNGFAMGAWIGGLFTYQAIRYLSEKGKYKLSVISPGTHKAEIIKAVKALGSNYDQVILGGYPPFIKDVLNEGVESGMNWGKYNLGIIFSAEGFSEAFRDYVIKHAGIKNKLKGTLNHYGIVDLGTVAYETPLSIFLRRAALKDRALYAGIFPEIHRLPTLAQYLPEMFYFEEQDGNLLCSAYSGLPLFRYDLKDRGGLFTYEQAERLWPELHKKALAAGIGDTLWKLPFVYVYERSDLVVSWYGANVYPEHIREAHLHKGLYRHLTGKFTVEVIADDKHNSVLQIHSELRRSGKNNRLLLAKLQQTILKILLKKNSEYRNSFLSLPEKQRMPRITLHGHQAAPYFNGGGKQKWVLKKG